MTKDIIRKTKHKNIIQHIHTHEDNINGPNNNGKGFNKKREKRKHVINKHYKQLLHIPIQLLALISWLIIPNKTDDKYRSKSPNNTQNEPIGMSAGRMGIIPRGFKESLETIGNKINNKTIKIIRRKIIDAATYVLSKQPRRIKKI